VTPKKSDRFDAWEASFRQRLGTLQVGSGNGASPDPGRRGPVAPLQPARRRPTIVSSLGMIAALLLGLILGAALWRDRAGATSIRVVTQTSIAASPTCREAVDRLERRLAVAAEVGRDPTRTVGTPPPAAAPGQASGSDAVRADYRNLVEQCGLR
jgi:hypothetical protein